LPDIPAEAVRAALAARSRALIDRPDPMVLSDETLTRMMLEAAAPVLAAAVAAKILAHMDEHVPKNKLIGGTPAERQRNRTWRRHFRIAAQVAALAFSTEDDIKRAAAEAIARGEAAVCHDHGLGER
jgi:hypothetical protein